MSGIEAIGFTAVLVLVGLPAGLFVVVSLRLMVEWLQRRGLTIDVRRGD